MKGLTLNSRIINIRIIYVCLELEKSFHGIFHVEFLARVTNKLLETEDLFPSNLYPPLLPPTASCKLYSCSVVVSIIPYHIFLLQFFLSVAMRNLALQGEIRHIVPTQNDNITTDVSNNDNNNNNNIIAVIQSNTNTDLHIGYDAGGDASGAAKQPPTSFIVTSDGHLLALDINDDLVWKVDLEKVVEDDDDDEKDDDDGQQAPSPVVSNQQRSRWFYAASFLQENSGNGDDGDDILNLASDDALHITCLSHAGHVVSVSIDATNSIALKGGGDSVIEQGSECIGSFDNGLLAGGWSPDGEVLALVTFATDGNEDGNNEEEKDGDDAEVKIPILMTMNTQYEVLSEVRLDPALVPLYTNDNNNTDGSNSASSTLLLHPNAITLCWRPDSSSLAISTMDAKVNEKPLRRIRTYHRSTLQILSLSKEEDGSGRDVPNLLPVAPTWAPAGCSHYVGAAQSSRPLSMKSARARISMQVAFMEPNGLRHRECKIHSTISGKTDKEDIIGVAFNLEGDMLAVTSRVTLGDSSQYGKVQLYHRSNYHWYLKYELRYDGKGSESVSLIVSGIKFSADDPHQLLVALNSQSVLEWREYTFRWESSTIHYSNRQSVLAMAIDGKKLNVTPLDKAIIPPPMYAFSLELDSPVVGITSRPTFYNEAKECQAEFMIALSDGKIVLLGSNGGSGQGPPSVMAIVDPFANNNSSDEISDDSGFTLQGMSLRDITIIDADYDSLSLVAASCPLNNSGKHQFNDNLVEMKISWITKDDGSDAFTADVMITSSLTLEGRALRIVNWSDTAYSEGARGSALIQLNDGSLHEYTKGGVLESCETGALLEACPWIAGVYNASSVTAASPSLPTTDEDAQQGHAESSNRLVIGLSTRYRLYCGERLLSNASSSFAISLEHRFITHVTIGSQPQLRFLPISSLNNFDPLMGSDDHNMALDGYEPRSVERGARLVAIFPSKPFVIIQLPRGNLESISPRALVLPYIMVKIQDGDFLTALDIMRRQRVDMNLIVDFDPATFLEKGGAKKFLGQIEKIDNVNLFLSSLIDVDTTLWKYPIPNWIRVEKGVPIVQKINKVCTKMREVMLDAEKEGVVSTSGKIIKEGHFLLPVLSTFAKESPPKLEEALTLIKSQAPQVDSSKKTIKKSPLLSEAVQSAIQYLAFLADYELLFNTAIGMYDFDLAKAVARHSQMDPKVYLPMLKRWRELPESNARYEVDVKLKRYESALRNLVNSSSQEGGNPDEDHFPKCLKFIEDHHLHKLGLELYKNDKSCYRSIMISLGERLLLTRKAKEALTIFLASNPRYLDGGKRASRACGDWRTYFSCCAEDGDAIDSDQVAAVAESISSTVGNMCEQRDNYASAATIFLDYGEDVSSAIDMFIAAHLWSEGRRIANKYDRPDLLKKVIDGCVSYSRTCVEDMTERSTTFEATNKRYSEVVVIRREAIREAEEAGVALYHDDSASMFSMQSTASNTSLRSSASGTSVGSVGTVGSVASVSTVISVGATSTFSFTGDVDAMKHASKYNKLGQNKKKKQRKKKGSVASRRTKPGSEEELNELVTTLKYACPDDHYVDVICETITFLLQCDKQSMATLLYNSYIDLEAVVERSQTSRLAWDNDEKVEREKKERKEGRIHESVEHSCEKGINAIRCKPLHESVRGTFSFLL